MHNQYRQHQCSHGGASGPSTTHFSILTQEPFGSKLNICENIEGVSRVGSKPAWLMALWAVTSEEGRGERHRDPINDISFVSKEGKGWVSVGLVLNLPLGGSVAPTAFWSVMLRSSLFRVRAWGQLQHTEPMGSGVKSRIGLFSDPLILGKKLHQLEAWSQERSCAGLTSYKCHILRQRRKERREKDTIPREMAAWRRQLSLGEQRNAGGQTVMSRDWGDTVGQPETNAFCRAGPPGEGTLLCTGLFQRAYVEHVRSVNILSPRVKVRELRVLCSKTAAADHALPWQDRAL